ncbi:MAG: phosphoenolpyruvate--protein phosphotransferase [Bacteroidota bacterium]|jgi:phosphotransferase system enzyme I (PtsI)
MSDALPSAVLLRGTAASAGVAIGRAIVVHPVWSEDATLPPPRGDVNTETERFRSAQRVVADELEGVAARARDESPMLSSILDTHQMIVTDPVLSSDIIERIASGVSSEAAIVHEFERQRRTLLASTNSMFRDRVHDLDHMKHQLLVALTTGAVAMRRDGESIVVAETVSPHDMLADHQLGIRAYVMKFGGIDAHASIIARDFGIPAVVGVQEVMTRIHDGDLVIVDGNRGVVICHPDETTLRHYQQLLNDQDRQRSIEQSDLTGPVHTSDGHHIALEANIDVPDQVPVAFRLGANGIGLVRTEMMVASINDIPSTDDQIAWYRRICQGAGGSGVTFRVFDLGSDKVDTGTSYVEDNPALGLRGIRFLLAQTEILRDQIMALLHVAQEYNVRCMLPMISTLDELVKAREILDECRAEFTRQHGRAPNMPLGIMIETPAAALSADMLAEAVDFFSIGTNDLTQYTLAVDRTNGLVSDSTDSLHPSVLRLIAMTVTAALSAGIPVTVCGEMAGQASALDLLVGLGVTGVSVSSFQLHDVRRRIAGISQERARVLAEQALRCRTAAEVADRVRGFQSASEGASA